MKEIIEYEDFSGTISEEFITSISDEFDIPADKIKRFTWELNYICGKFIERRKLVERLGSDAEQRKELQHISKQVSKFSAFLDTLTEPYQQLLENRSYNLTEDDYEIECRLYEMNNSALEPVEQGFRTYPDRYASFFRSQNLRKQLDLLVSAASEISELEIGTQKRGAKGDRDLDIWMKDIRSLWRNLLCRKFKRDEMGGVAISEAARFCVAVFAELEPQTSQSTVLNAMKKRITRDRKSPHWHD